MPLPRSAIAACLVLIAAAPPAFAHREDYIDETLVFVTLEKGALEPEYWFDAGHAGPGNFTRHNLALEYGITEHWMVDARGTFLDDAADGFHFDSSRVETRYRFFDEGTLPIDIAVSGEINTFRDEAGHQRFGVEPRLILSKDLGALNLTLNLAEEVPVSRRKSSLEIRGGWRYDASELIRFGTEFSYDTETHSVAAIPQVWLAFPRDVTLKSGYSYNFGDAHERFFRVALEMGF